MSAVNKLAQVFDGKTVYEYTTTFSPDPSDDCFICRTPYQPRDLEGCVAIQLSACGHIIGQ
jgi:hypothetical protein